MDRAIGFYPIGWGFESSRARLGRAAAGLDRHGILACSAAFRNVLPDLQCQRTHLPSDRNEVSGEPNGSNSNNGHGGSAL